MFNTAEAYFRNAEYEKSIKLFDEFIKHYSYEDYASQARLRIALGYDLTGRNIKEILALYKDAINKISNPKSDHSTIESEISLNPTVNHQIIKNGFSALNKIPERNGPYFVLI